MEGDNDSAELDAEDEPDTLYIFRTTALSPARPVDESTDLSSNAAEQPTIVWESANEDITSETKEAHIVSRQHSVSTSNDTSLWDWYEGTSRNQSSTLNDET